MKNMYIFQYINVILCFYNITVFWWHSLMPSHIICSTSSDITLYVNVNTHAVYKVGNTCPWPAERVKCKKKTVLRIPWHQAGISPIRKVTLTTQTPNFGYLTKSFSLFSTMSVVITIPSLKTTSERLCNIGCTWLWKNDVRTTPRSLLFLQRQAGKSLKGHGFQSHSLYLVFR